MFSIAINHSFTYCMEPPRKNTPQKKVLPETPISMNPADKELLEAAAHGNIAKVRELLTPQNLNTRCTDGRTALHWAALNGHGAVVKYLLENGAPTNTTKEKGVTPLHSASLRGHEEIVRLLVDRGAPIECTTDEGSTPLYCAAQEGHTSAADYLLSKHANKDAVKSDGWTPMHIAAYEGHYGVVELLLKEGSIIDARNNHDRTPLYYAVRQGHEIIATTLVNNGARITPKILERLKKKRSRVFEMLTNRSAQNNELFDAARSGNCDKLRVALSDKEYLIHAQNDRGETVLHIAAHEGQTVVVKLLLEHGARKNTLDDEGRTPLNAASARGHEAVVRLLLN